MSTDLHARATAQHALLEAAAAEVVAALAAGNTELGRRHPDPGSLAVEQWAGALGAVQHESFARGALVRARADQATARQRIAEVANPADVATWEAELRTALVREARVRPELRRGSERVAAGTTAAGALAPWAAATGAELRASADRVAAAEAQQARDGALRTALTAAPLDTVADDATDLRTGSAFDAAEDRLAALLPAELRARAEDRAAEAAQVETEGEAAVAASAAHLDDLALAAQPLEAAVRLGERRLESASRALQAYVGSARGRIASAAAALAEVAAHPDLTTEQVAALATSTERTEAAEREEALAGALQDVRAAESALADAELDARAADPDVVVADDPAVQAAQTALDDATLQDPLDQARTDYDATTRDTLDLWEVEVPPDLWAALDDFVEARRGLDELGSATHVDDLVAALDAAETALGSALDSRDQDTRRRWFVGLADADRTSAAAGRGIVATDRRRQYVAGDGPAGRILDELFS